MTTIALTKTDLALITRAFETGLPDKCQLDDPHFFFDSLDAYIVRKALNDAATAPVTQIELPNRQAAIVLNACFEVGAGMLTEKDINEETYKRILSLTEPAKAD